METIEHIYIHVPFCKRKCPYCDFYSEAVSTDDNALFEEYTEAIISEINASSFYLKKQSVKTVYMGGGSPALLGLENIERIFETLNPYLSDKCESTIEMNPEHFEKNNLVKGLKKIGINRISIGVQSSIEKLLKNINRKYSKPLLIKNIELIKEQKIILSLDFMFGLPEQTKEDLFLELDFIKNSNPQHVSYYMFTVAQKDKWQNLPDDETINEMFKILHDGMEKIDLSHYEISNYAATGYECKHNTAYWLRKSYLGIGAAAHGYFKEQKRRYWNIKDIKKYMDYENKMEDFEILSDDAERSEEIMLGMRLLKKGVSLDLVNKTRLDMLRARNLIIIDEKSNCVRLGDQGIALLNSVVSALV